MKTKTFFSLIIFFSLLFINPFSLKDVRAVTTPNEIKTHLNKICLKGEGANQLDKTVSIVPTDKITVKLGGTGFMNTGAVYVALCLPGEKKSVCTTGKPDTDIEIFGQDYSDQLVNFNADAGTWKGYIYGTKNTAGLGIDVVPNKIMPVGNEIHTVVNITGFQGHFVYPFFGFYKDPMTTVQTGEAGGDQQGQIPFDAADKNCISILYDPYGRIFDSQSLEPIPGMTIKVLTSITPSQMLAQIFGNPQTTHEDGAFNFLVEPGTYYLRMETMPLKYAFTATPQLGTNYMKAFSKRDGTNSLYKPDEAIVEVANKPEHRDIPLDPGKNPPGHFPITNITSYGFNQMSFGNTTNYGGKISHPLSLVALVGKNSGKEVVRTSADKFGYWGVEVSNEVIPQDEPLLIKLIKVDLTTMKADEKNGRITNDVTFYPIARQIQGTVYENNTPVPYAPVAIITENNNKPFIKVTADNKGFISIPTNNLPNFSYNLSVTSSSSAIPKLISPDVFAKENKVYLEKSGVNLMIEDSTSKKTTVTQNVNKTDLSGKNNNSLKPTQVSNTSSPENQKSSKYVFIILFVIFLLITLSIGIVIYLKKQKNDTQLMQ